MRLRERKYKKSEKNFMIRSIRVLFLSSNNIRVMTSRRIRGTSIFGAQCICVSYDSHNKLSYFP